MHIVEFDANNGDKKIKIDNIDQQSIRKIEPILHESLVFKIFGILSKDQIILVHEGVYEVIESLFLSASFLSIHKFDHCEGGGHCEQDQDVCFEVPNDIHKILTHGPSFLEQFESFEQFPKSSENHDIHSCFFGTFIASNDVEPIQRVLSCCINDEDKVYGANSQN